MRKYRVVYWLGSMKTEKIIKAESEEAVRELLADKRIEKIEEVE